MCKQKISTLLLVVLLTFSFAGCKQETIPDKDMVKILAEVFITDAIVSTSHYSYKFSKRDTIEYYKPIYSQLGYTDKQFANTIDYYFENPKEFDRVLDKVVNYLAQVEAEHKARMLQDKEEQMDEVKFARDPKNLWELNESYKFPDDGDQDSLFFRIPIMGDGNYRLTAMVKVLPNDESIDPYAAIWFARDSSGIRYNVSKQQYSKSGRDMGLSLTLTLRDSAYTHIEGVIMGHIEQDGDWKKFAEVRNLRIAYTPFVPLESDVRRVPMERVPMEIDTSYSSVRTLEKEEVE